MAGSSIVGGILYSTLSAIFLIVPLKILPDLVLGSLLITIAIVIKRLPKTRSGKILRGTIRKIADSVEYKMPPTIDDPAILDEIKEDLIKNNILKSA